MVCGEGLCDGWYVMRDLCDVWYFVRVLCHGWYVVRVLCGGSEVLCDVRYVVKFYVMGGMW